MHPPSWPVLALLGILVTPTAAHADPALFSDDDRLDDQQVDGDIDGEDRASARFGSSAGSADAHAQSWVTLAGFTRQLMSGRNDVGGMVVVGLALDRIAAGPTHLADPPHPVRAVPETATESLAPVRTALVAPSLARECVAVALRASGLGVDDSRIDALMARARMSAWLPETRMRAMRLMTDAAHATTLATTDGTTYYDAVGANLVVELRLTWRFDRLLFSGDEPALERMRLEREDARSRLSRRTLDVLFAWQRASVDADAALTPSPEEREARLREAEAFATLDVLTNGWFSRRESREKN